MNKKARYWAAAIIIAVILIIAVWVAAANRSSKSDNMNHEDMVHSGAGSSPSQAESNLDNSALNSYLKEQNDIMSEMMKDMGEIEKSGNASIDFLKGMIPHHKSAVDMAESYLMHGGSSDSLRQIADNIIETQTKEIDQMKSMIQALQESGRTDEAKENAYLDAYSNMMSNHHMGHGTAAVPSNIDAAFSAGMIEHHKMAVDMAKAILNHSDETDVQELAQSMIKMQEEEIAQMENFINDTQK